MIRFIDLKDQIHEGFCEFAFYDTTVDEFLKFDDTQTFCSLEEFKVLCTDTELRDRCIKLIPEEYKLFTIESLGDDLQI